MNKQELRNKWKAVVPQIDSVIERMQEKSIIAVGITPYPRIVPSTFLDNYYIYAVRSSTDVDVLKQYAKVYCMEEKYPDVATKVQSTTYLLSHARFKEYLKRLKYPYRLMLNLTTAPIVRKMDELGVEWIGNRAETFADVEVKLEFRALVERLGLPHMPYWQLPRKDFLALSFTELFDRWKSTVVVQRADSNVTGEEARTFFVDSEEEWRRVHDVFTADERFAMVQLSPFISGQSVSMLGCVTAFGVLSSTLQMELVDIPEVIGDAPRSGAWLGHDWGVHPWSEAVEQGARRVVEGIGAYLAAQGYKGVFGIDFVYQEGTDNIYPVECNPRYTGAQPTLSLLQMHHQGVPPLDFFHLMTHLNIEADVNVELLQQRYAQHAAVSQLCIQTNGIRTMKLPLSAGVYSFDAVTKELTFLRAGAFLWDMVDSEREFLLIDTIPHQGQMVQQTVQRLCKFVFPRSIATSSRSLDADASAVVSAVTQALRKNQ